jgi:hypothetical protein
MKPGKQRFSILHGKIEKWAMPVMPEFQLRHYRKRLHVDKRQASSVYGNE